MKGAGSWQGQLLRVVVVVTGPAPPRGTWDGQWAGPRGYPSGHLRLLRSWPLSQAGDVIRMSCVRVPARLPVSQEISSRRLESSEPQSLLLREEVVEVPAGCSGFVEGQR